MMKTNIFALLTLAVLLCAVGPTIFAADDTFARNTAAALAAAGTGSGEFKETNKDFVPCLQGDEIGYSVWQIGVFSVCVGNNVAKPQMIVSAPGNSVTDMIRLPGTQNEYFFIESRGRLLKGSFSPFASAQNDWDVTGSYQLSMESWNQVVAFGYHAPIRYNINLDRLEHQRAWDKYLGINCIFFASNYRGDDFCLSVSEGKVFRVKNVFFAGKNQFLTEHFFTSERIARMAVDRSDVWLLVGSKWDYVPCVAPGPCAAPAFPTELGGLIRIKINSDGTASAPDKVLAFDVNNDVISGLAARNGVVYYTENVITPPGTIRQQVIQRYDSRTGHLQTIVEPVLAPVSALRFLN